MRSRHRSAVQTVFRANTKAVAPLVFIASSINIPQLYLNRVEKSTLIQEPPERSGRASSLSNYTFSY